MLIVSALFRGWKMSLFAFPAAAIALLGPFFGVPGIAILGPRATSAAIAGGLFFFGLLLGRTADD